MPTCVRASAETMPCVTVCPTPNGLPIASTTSPTCSVVGIAELDRRETLAAVLDAQHREIGARVLQHDLGLEFALVGERDLHLGRALDHVVVGDDEAAGIDDHARSRASAASARAGYAGGAEEAAEERIVEQRIAVLDHLGGIDIDHRGRRPLHDRGEGELSARRRARHHPFLRALPGTRDSAMQRARRSASDRVRRLGMRIPRWIGARYRPAAGQ